MTKEKVVAILSEISELKKNTGLRIIDTHVHPLDVMGAVHYTNIKNEYSKQDYSTPGILEKFNYGKTAQIGSKLFCKLMPRGANKIIKINYGKVSDRKIIEEMDFSLIDSAVMLPVAPWLPTEAIGDRFLSSKFALLGSVDIHNIRTEEIDNYLKGLKEKYHISGIKLHPNLQNFKPQPSHNPKDLGEKLHRLYKFAEREHLYLLFHGGVSFYTNLIDAEYPENFNRSHTNAVLKNFCNNDGKSELFENYNIPVVIAHLGHYGIINPDYKLIGVIAKKFDNVYFDTAGVSPSFLKNVMNFLPSKNIIFGSDALYNRMAYNLAFAYLAIRGTENGEKTENIISNIFQNNYFNITSI